MKKALITGISGQDGSYLAELLLSKGYEVHGIVRRQSLEAPSQNLSNLECCRERVNLHVASLDNHLSLYKVIQEVQPDELYHLAASSFVSYNFDDESSILTSNFNGTHYLLSSIKEVVPNCRFCFAGTSEMFGRVAVTPQNELTPFNPRSIYGVSKLASYHLVANYREQYGIFACTAILYNHESPRRDFKFVTRKITAAAAKIKLGLENRLYLGNLDAVRDWGYAPDYVHGMWLMLQHHTPDDYVIASGVTHAVRKFVDCAFKSLGLDYNHYVEVDPRFYRAAEKVPLCGDSSKIRTILGWASHKPLEEIIQEMIAHDLKLFSPDAGPPSYRPG
ncbi:GDP-mannose 4,6-dehydratase [Leptolyngbya sp. 'hensonii']|uniref:GDP-mannose 4,6-dehydratase n=1 Tax=Leptolyngbya sp. 'hensonii' TaxID=1922337 RepID=UPI00094FC958|nr:GDP-mannose 4,6-dehydratase [Leptolyngbya sp. 'hensonii']OLP18836.1 GDP-mannose 4,6-dehydratase [Leptolyngbya sp. 'hensonii']